MQRIEFLLVNLFIVIYKKEKKKIKNTISISERIITLEEKSNS